MFDKLKKLWTPDTENHSEDSGNRDQRQSAVGSAIELRRELIGKIVGNAAFKPLWGSDFIADTFVLWVTAVRPAYQIEAGKADFLDALREDFDNERLEAVGAASWLVETGRLPENANFTKIDDGVYIEIRPAANKPHPFGVPHRARISVVGNSGSLMQDAYLLDASKQPVYQIGRGENNHIAIWDSEEAPVNNRLVSRAHAQIMFIENKGFCLKSLNDANRTIVYRGGTRVEDIRELNSVSNPLQTGDLIELGKAVSLKFELVGE